MFLGSLKILEKALLWKQQAAAASASEDLESSAASNVDGGSVLGKRTLAEVAADVDAIDIDDI